MRRRPGEGDEQRRFNNFFFNLLVFIPFLPQVFITVVHKRIQLDKSLVAHFAVIGPLSFVETYVQPDVRRPYEGAAADAALEVPRAALCLLGLLECRC